jgi:hypothetical protein
VGDLDGHAAPAAARTIHSATVRSSVPSDDDPKLRTAF